MIFEPVYVEYTRFLGICYISYSITACFSCICYISLNNLSDFVAILWKLLKLQVRPLVQI